MKVVVYVRASDVRRLVGSGVDELDVPAWVRGAVVDALARVNGSPPVSSVDRSASASTSESTARAAGACPMVVPRGVRCKACGKVHQG